MILFIVYGCDTWSRDLNCDFFKKNCLYGGVKLTKNANRDRYIYSGYGVGFDLRSEFSLPNGSVGKNVFILRIGMSSSVHIDNNKKDVLVLGKG